MGSVLKISHWFLEKSFCEIRIYLFCSYLRFKSLYKFLGIKLYDSPLKLQNTPLKFKIKAFKILILLVIKFAKKEWFYDCYVVINSRYVVLYWNGVFCY